MATLDQPSQPARVDMRCPACGSSAQFEEAEAVRIRLRADVPFFQESSLFEYRKYENSTGERGHAAIYYALLHGPAETTIVDLPDGYRPSDWAHSRHSYFRFTKGPRDGAVACGACGLHVRHTLQVA